MIYVFEILAVSLSFLVGVYAGVRLEDRRRRRLEAYWDSLGPIDDVRTEP